MKDFFYQSPSCEIILLVYESSFLQSGNGQIDKPGIEGPGEIIIE